MTETTEENQTELEQIGQLLQEAREKKNLTLEQAAEKTRIHINTLQKIEDGQMGSNPGPVFMRGFIRTYGEFVGLDTQMLLEKLKSVAELQEPAALSGGGVISSEPERSFLQEQKFLIFFFIVLLLGVGYFLFNYFMPSSVQFLEELQSANPTQTASPVEPVVEINPVDSPSIQEEQSSSQPPSQPEPTPPTTQQEIVQTPEEVPTVPTTLVVTPSVASLEQLPPAEEPEIIEPELLVLSMKATLSTWVDVRVDDEEPLEISLQSGEEYIIEAKERFILTIGNTKGVEFFLNGILQTIDSQNELLENWILDNSKLPPESQ